MRRLLVVVASLFFLKAQAQNTISGKVLDARDNSPLQSVTVAVKGGRTSTTTDLRGQFAVNVPGGGILTFSAIGFTTKEVAASSNPLIIFLEVSQKSLEEVIVTGYATQNKRQ